jgi:hypothetical protein
MKKMIGKVPRPKGLRSYIRIDEVTKRTSPVGTILYTYATDDKSISLDAISKPAESPESGELDISEANHKISSQNDSRQGTNVFLIEDYAELLVRKLRPLKCYSNKLEYYSSSDL